MKFRKLLSLICLCCLLFINFNTIQAAEVAPEQAVVSVTLMDNTVHYYDSIDDAIAEATANDNSTLQLLANIETNGIVINAGKFTVDLNGYTLSCDSISSATVLVLGGEIRFTDNSSEKKGTIRGTSSAIQSRYDGKIDIQGGNYIADTWTISLEQGVLNISAGYFKGNVPVQVYTGSGTISGGKFEGVQCALYNVGTTTVTGGTFLGGIENGSAPGVLNFQGGSIVITGGNGNNVGVDNRGNLYLSGGTISVKDGANIEAKGVTNGVNASLYLSGDVTFQDMATDFVLSKDMYVSGTLTNSYTVKAAIPTDGTEPVVVRGSGCQVNKDNFVSNVSGYRLIAAEDNSNLYISVCNHQLLDGQFVCQECGGSMQAKIGEKYYETLDNAFKAVTGTDQVVELVVDVEDAIIPGGTFTLDLNGHAITDSLSVNGGKVILKGTGADDEYIQMIYIEEGADVEIQGVTVKADAPIYNLGKLTMTSGKLVGGDVGIINYAGTVNLVGGEITTDEIGILNICGNLSVGEGEAGPVIKAPIGIINGKPDMGGQLPDSVLNIKGGKFIAETDIYNKTGDFSFESGASSQMPLIAGTVKINGGTFEDGIKVQLDAGEDLTDILAEDYGYYGADEQVISVEAGATSLDQTVTVKALTQDDSDDQETETGTTDGNDTTEDKTEADDGVAEDNSATEDKTESNGGETDDHNTTEQNTDAHKADNNNDHAVETGDSTNVGVLLVAMLVSGIVLIRMNRKNPI